MSEWPPHVTVATIVERDGLYLMVKETREGRQVYNQPAGHLEANESLQQAAIRETLEETGWHVNLEAGLGTVLFKAPANGVTYMRTTFIARVERFDPSYTLDQDIDEALWLSYEAILDLKDQLRSPIVLDVIDEYRAGHRIALERFTSLNLNNE